MSRFAEGHLRHALADHYRAVGLWRDLTLDAQFDAAVSAVPNTIAITDESRAVTYAELGDEVGRAASALHALGVGSGDVVAWMLPNWVEAAVIHHAVVRLGAVSNPIIPIYRHREVGFILRQGAAKVVVIPAEFRSFDYPAMMADLRGDLPDLQHVVVSGGAAGTTSNDTHCYEELVGSSQQGVPTAGHAADDPVLLLYTSGTTADPKGAVHSHNTLDHENRTIIDLYGLTGDDVVFMPSPVTHITGVLYGLHLPAMLASSAVYEAVWNPNVALELLERHQATFVVGATPFLHGLTYHPRLESHELALRVFACGGADVPPQLITDASERLHCCATRIYGSTEYPTLTGGGPADRLRHRARSDGRVIGAAEIRLVDDDGVDVETGAVGEILARGPEMFLGYLDSEITSESVSDDGWFATGDLASIDRDGYVTIVGRKKDIIVRGGENLSAKEIEDLLFEHPSVAEVAVVGMPDPVMVERVCAFVVPAEGSEVVLDELIAHLRGRQVANQKLPERLEIVGELPKTASGKVQKFRLRDDIRDRLADEGSLDPAGSVG